MVKSTPLHWVMWRALVVSQGMRSQRNMLLNSIAMAISLVLNLDNRWAFYISRSSGFKYTLHTAYTHRKYCNITYVSQENLKSTRMLTISLFEREKETLQKCNSPVNLLKGMLATDLQVFQPIISQTQQRGRHFQKEQFLDVIRDQINHNFECENSSFSYIFLWLLSLPSLEDVHTHRGS